MILLKQELLETNYSFMHIFNKFTNNHSYDLQLIIAHTAATYILQLSSETHPSTF